MFEISERKSKRLRFPEIQMDTPKIILYDIIINNNNNNNRYHRQKRYFGQNLETLNIQFWVYEKHTFYMPT